MNKLTYAGIGSRETPGSVLKLFECLGSLASSYGFTLRSGHADGADKAFESGCDLVHGSKEIYLPWKGFNGSDSPLYNISDEATQLASKYHPVWHKLSPAPRKLMARNVYQILGESLNDPVSLVICYTPNGFMSGGTSQALRIARDHRVEVINAGSYTDFNKFMRDVLLAISTYSYGVSRTL